MPWSRETALRRAVGDYKQGGRIALLASKYNVNYQAINLALKKAGVSLRPPGTDRRTPVDAAAIVAAYLSGDSILSVAIAHRVSRPVVERRLAEAGVRKRTASEQSFISAARQSPEDRQARAAAAHAAVRGSKRTASVSIAMAIKRQVAAKLTPKEQVRYDNLLAAGIVTVPQYACGKYSIDLAIPDARIAIEVKSGWSGHGKKGEQEAAKKADLKSWGWLMIEMHGTDWRPGWVEKVRMYIVQRRAMMLR